MRRCLCPYTHSHTHMYAHTTMSTLAFMHTHTYTRMCPRAPAYGRCRVLSHRKCQCTTSHHHARAHAPRHPRIHLCFLSLSLWLAPISLSCCVVLADEAIAKLGDIGLRTSLRYAVQLLTPARIMATTQSREKITADDVDEVDELFYDAKASAQVLVEQSAKYLL